ncbi:glucan endo-1,3-beta-glucosidase 13 isoform X2 [Vigna radiata var. radiata]|uniref:Glucan endo-1,3-beta-glucosidase 13 isoform X2 n=1 Tax=Vigna radiata var. radiata TaxID=3916 RepID=A0A3Q0F7N8_VIGRR|nr:glucan endo-1,3-beta-glucosidase 13 isoform X2 [Vigna radiata var. radiata]
MTNKICLFLFLIFIQCYLAMAREIVVQQKSDAAIPVTTMSPPEGNTTFIDGTTWCVARPGASQNDLQNALDWACGLGMANCKAIQQGGPCFEPDTLVSHASYAFNSYYQTNGNSDIACNFGGTAALTKRDPNLWLLLHHLC